MIMFIQSYTLGTVNIFYGVIIVQTYSAGMEKPFSFFLFLLSVLVKTLGFKVCNVILKPLGLKTTRGLGSGRVNLSHL